LFLDSLGCIFDELIHTDHKKFKWTAPATSVRGLAEHVADTFVESPRHAHTRGKTLSVVDTGAYPVFQASFDALAASLAAAVDATTFAPVVRAAQETERYSGGDAMDLHDFLTRIKAVLPAQATAVDTVLADLAATVVYAVEDGANPRSHGLSMFGLRNDLWSNGDYTTDNCGSGPLYTFVSAIMTFDDADTEDPSAAVVANSEGGGTPGSGTCFLISDNFAVKNADTVLLA